VFLALLGSGVLAVLAMFAIMQWSISRGFLQYVDTLEQERLQRVALILTETYANEKSWNGLRDNPPRILEILFRTLPDKRVGPEHFPGIDHSQGTLAPVGGSPPEQAVLPGIAAKRSVPMPGSMPVPPSSLFAPFPPLHDDRQRPFPSGPPHRFAREIFLLDGDHQRIFGPRDIPSGSDLLPLTHAGKIIGYLGLVRPKEISDIHQLRFVKSQKLALALVAGAVMVVSALFSLPLARKLSKPIKTLAGATKGLAGGNYSLRVPVVSSDEMGQLARDFNALAFTLERNEQMRRQWIADTSHELRTPLAVLRGEIEALLDGVRVATPGSIASLHTEVLRLERLVDDLYQLSLSDVGGLTYRKKPLDLKELLIREFDLFRREFVQKGITARFLAPEGSCAALFADLDRLRQLFGNLLENSLKYTDPGGRMEIRLQCRDDKLRVDICDSAPGVPESELPRLFERLYRVETSRSRSSGGAGLGLAICKNIVEAHDGEITAQASDLGGVWVAVTFPLNGETG
jgi:two-component system sensor histidine kinase BaeS